MPGDKFQFSLCGNLLHCYFHQFTCIAEFIHKILFIFSDMDAFIDLTDVQTEEVVLTDAPAPAPDAATVVQVGQHTYVSALLAHPDVVAALVRAPELHRSAFRCLLATKATGTIRAYTSAVDRFEQFCMKHGLPFPAFTTDCLVQYVLFLDSSNASYSAYKTLKPALTFFEQA